MRLIQFRIPFGLLVMTPEDRGDRQCPGVQIAGVNLDYLLDHCPSAHLGRIVFFAAESIYPLENLIRVGEGKVNTAFVARLD